ncbi:MBL fold metallo-hydrolase [Hydrogenobaculum sp.]|nr:MAG: hypothetical protein C0194_00850 [Hydrogenobaculum sp.]PMP89687.1 MAG: hypothetical protein C0170_07930 [Hydrogenobaculum sp.]
MEQKVKIETIATKPIDENCTVIKNEETKEAIVVDPGSDIENILEAIKDFKVVAILATHGHYDHVGQVATLKEIYNAPFYINKEDEFLLKDEILPGFSLYLNAKTPPKPDFYLKDEDKLNIAGIDIEVIHTPGHTPGGCCFYIKSQNTLIAGDTLFKGGVGRTDLPGGSWEKLASSLKKIFSTFPKDTKVICGHYQDTTLEHELKFNPFLRGLW